MMDGSRTIVMDVSQNDQVSDVMKRIPNGGDMYVTSAGRVLRRSDELRSGGVRDSSTVQVVRRFARWRMKRVPRCQAEERRDLQRKRNRVTQHTTEEKPARGERGL